MEFLNLSGLEEPPSMMQETNTMQSLQALQSEPLLELDKLN
jgi:hypothetical protein